MSANIISTDTSAILNIDPADVVARLEKINSFLLCVRETLRVDGSNEGIAAADVILHVQNLVFKVQSLFAPDVDAMKGGSSTSAPSMFQTEDVQGLALRVDRLETFFQAICRLSLTPEMASDDDIRAIAEIGRSEAETLSIELRGAGVAGTGEVAA